MAISTATVVRAYDHQKLDQRTYTISGDEYELYTCKIDCEFKTVDYATANDATITAATAIQNSKRNGNSVTILGCCVVRGGVFRLAATPTVDRLCSAGVPSSISASVVTLPLTAEDLTTEMTDATVLSTSTWVQPLVFQMFYAEKALGE